MVVNLALRVFAKAVIVFVFLLPLALFTSAMAQVLAILIFFIGVFSIFETLRIYATIQLQEDVLMVERAFDGRRRYQLSDVEAWKENRYYLRGHLRRVLILFFNGQRVILSLYNDETEFDNLSRYLHARYKDRAFQ